MKRIVLIDGENLSRAIRNLAGTLEEPAPRSMLATFNFRSLVKEVTGDEKKASILYFGAKLHKYDHTPELLKQSEEVISIQAKLVNSLQKQGINFIKVGYLRARESKECPNCKHVRWHLIEKGVDVGLATRMITEAGEGTEIILFSADTDLLPAVKEAVKQGSRVVFVGYEYQPALALAKSASSTRLITKQMVEKALSESSGKRK